MHCIGDLLCSGDLLIRSIHCSAAFELPIDAARISNGGSACASTVASSISNNALSCFSFEPITNVPILQYVSNRKTNVRYTFDVRRVVLGVVVNRDV